MKKGVGVLLITVFCWILLAEYRPKGFNPESYYFSLLATGIKERHDFSTTGVRDVNGPVVFPQPVRSNPPLFPALVALVNSVTGKDMLYSIAVLNGLLLFLTALVFSSVIGKMAGPSYGFLSLAFPVFFFRDGGYASDSAIVGTLVLTLLLLLAITWVMFGILERGPHWREACLLGALLALLSLTREEQRYPALLYPLLVGAFLYSRIGFRKVALFAGFTLLFFALFYSPWLVRNWLVFGQAFSSTANYPTAGTGGGGGLDFVLSAVPNADDWLSQRLQYFRQAFFELEGRTGNLLFLFLVVAAFWKGMRTEIRLFLSVLMVSGSVFFAGSVVTGWVAPRYYSLLHLTVILAYFLIISKVAPRLALRGLSVVLVLYLLVGMFVRLNKSSLSFQAALLDQGASTLRAVEAARFPYTRFVEEMGPYAKERATFAVEDSDGFAHFTGLLSMYFPQNIHEPGPLLDAWLTRWRPTYILCNSHVARSLKIEEATIAKPLGYHLIETSRLGLFSAAS